jgi:hypothetical protein
MLPTSPAHQVRWSCGVMWAGGGARSLTPLRNIHCDMAAHTHALTLLESCTATRFEHNLEQPLLFERLLRAAATAIRTARTPQMMMTMSAPAGSPSGDEDDEPSAGGGVGGGGGRGCGDGGGGGGYDPTKGAWVTDATVREPPPTLTAASMPVAAVASAVAVEMLICTAEDDAAGAVIVTSSTTLPAVTVTSTSAAFTPLPAVFATAVLMSSMAVGV